MYVVLESILFVLTEGCSWRAVDRPQARWNSVYQYFRRWCHRGTLQKVLAQFGPELVPGWFFVDSTHVKVDADGSNPAGGQHFLEGAAVTPLPEILVHRIPAGLWPIDSSPAAPREG